jgi:hypothetical protein
MKMNSHSILRLGIILIILSLIVFASTTFALFSFSLSKSTTLSFSKIQISASTSNINLKATLNNIIPGDDLIEQPLKFTVDSNSLGFFVRAKLKFSSTSTEISSYITTLNELTVSEWGISSNVTGTKWVKGDNNFYYLVNTDADSDDTNNLVFNVNYSSTPTTDNYYLFTNHLIVPLSLPQIYDSSDNPIQYGKQIECEFGYQAVQSSNYKSEDGSSTSPTLANVVETLNAQFGTT